MLVKQHALELAPRGITVNGIDLRELKQVSLRGAIAIVPQDTVLFNDTIRYNIHYGRPQASEAVVIQRGDRIAQMVFQKVPAVDLVEEKPWEPGSALVALNPAGMVPVFVDDTGLAVSGVEAMAAQLKTFHATAAASGFEPAALRA